MNRRLCVLLLAAFLAAPALAGAQVPAAIAGRPTATEKPFVDQMTVDLERRFPTAADAEKAGYLRYTEEDETGAISYANREWVSKDASHPSQLWYDVHGHLLGADFSVLQKDYAAPPMLWGVMPSRWQKIGAHIHYGLTGPNGTVTFGEVGAKKFAAAGGNVDNPTAADLVKAGAAKSARDVKFVFLFPAIWDLIVWVVPNPSGAFAEMNPNVKPSKPAAHSM
jgi:hypothetical protein